MAQDDNRIRITPAQAARIVGTYAGHQLLEQLIVVIPVVAYMVLFQLVILRHHLEKTLVLSGGITLVILGLMFFMESIKIALLPLAETVGRVLPERKKIGAVLVFAFLLGLLAAYGEPVIGSLQIAGAGVDPNKAPLLYTLLLGKPWYLVACISVGVGLAFLIGMLRTVRGWSVRPLVLGLVGIAAVLSLLAIRSPATAAAMGLAWDAGAVIAGPVSTPIMLALGMGIFAASGRSDSGMAGFGNVGLMSLLPIVLVLLLIFFVGSFVDYEAIAKATAASRQAAAPGMAALAWESLVNSVRAIVPVFTFLYVALRFWLREEEEGVPVSHFIIAAAFAILGLFLFNFGLSIGLSDLGNQVGNRLPLSFHPEQVSLYGGTWGGGRSEGEHRREGACHDSRPEYQPRIGGGEAHRGVARGDHPAASAGTRNGANHRKGAAPHRPGIA